MTRDEWRQVHERMQAQKKPAAAPVCHPDRAHVGRGMCDRCYQRWYRAQRRMALASVEEMAR